MSKTYRNRSHRYPHCFATAKNQKKLQDRDLFDYGANRCTKDHTKWARRQDERQQLSKLRDCSNVDDFDFVNREKLFKGVIWNYD